LGKVLNIQQKPLVITDRMTGCPHEEQNSSILGNELYFQGLPGAGLYAKPVINAQTAHPRNFILEQDNGNVIPFPRGNFFINKKILQFFTASQTQGIKSVPGLIVSYREGKL
jgi:hypothetical protein